MSKKMSALQKLGARVAPVTVDEGKAVAIPLNKISFDPTQPRQAFHHPDGRIAEDDEASLDELARSIESQGLIHPITVEPIGDGTFRVVVGERRTRAYLKLGRTTIEAKIRDDLTNPKRRLIYQVAENVNRKDLTDADMAKSIRSLMEGTDAVEPMTQTQIAQSLGKSEGWVSRYVRFGDDEQQRLWVQTGIADTVEKLYRLSLLPMYMHAEILRRVQLPEDDPEHLAKPLNRAVIDDFALIAKIAKKGAQPPSVSPPSAKASSAAAQAVEERTAAPSDPVGDGIPNDPVSRAFAEMAEHGREPVLQTQTSAQQKPSSTAGGGTGYTLSEGDRARILSTASVTLSNTDKAAAQPPVSVRVPVASLQALLLKLEPADQEALAGMQLSINLPGPLAERIANTLTGIVVDPSEVPAVVQNELVKLQ